MICHPNRKKNLFIYLNSMKHIVSYKKGKYVFNVIRRIDLFTEF